MPSHPYGDDTRKRYASDSGLLHVSFDVAMLDLEQEEDIDEGILVMISILNRVLLSSFFDVSLLSVSTLQTSYSVAKC